jgi:hypothetical protein
MFTFNKMTKTINNLKYQTLENLERNDLSGLSKKKMSVS